MKKILFSVAIIIIYAVIVISWYFLSKQEKFPISKYFPLNENDTYIYNHRDGTAEELLTITVKNVKSLADGRQFDFLWQSKLCNRSQTLKLSPGGLELCEDRFLAGTVPMKSVRIPSPPLLMIPSILKKGISLSSIQPVYTFEGKLLYTEEVEEGLSFVGTEEITVEAGKFRCLHFFTRHNYKDESGNSKHAHTYDFWIAPGIGLVKFVHSFVPFMYLRYVGPGEKGVMNRYDYFFVEVLELKNAKIGSTTIGIK